MPIRLADWVVGLELSVTVTVADRAPSPEGVKMMLMTQVLPALPAGARTKLSAQVVPAAVVKSLAFKPPITTELEDASVTGVPPLFVNVSFCGALAVPVR